MVGMVVGTVVVAVVAVVAVVVVVGRSGYNVRYANADVGEKAVLVRALVA